MSQQLEMYIQPVITTGNGVFSYLAKSLLTVKVFTRSTKAYVRFNSHGVKDPVFICNAASSIFAGGSLLTLSGARILRFTHFSHLSAHLFVASSTLGSMSDTLDNSYIWSSPLI